MKRAFLALCLFAAGCASTPTTVPYTHVPGQVTVTEFDRNNNPVGPSYLVDGLKLQRDIGAGTLSGPGLPHPMKNYSVDR